MGMTTPAPSLLGMLWSALPDSSEGTSSVTEYCPLGRRLRPILLSVLLRGATVGGFLVIDLAIVSLGADICAGPEGYGTAKHAQEARINAITTEIDKGYICSGDARRPSYIHGTPMDFTKGEDDPRGFAEAHSGKARRITKKICASATALPLWNVYEVEKVAAAYDLSFSS